MSRSSPSDRLLANPSSASTASYGNIADSASYTTEGTTTNSASGGDVVSASLHFMTLNFIDNDRMELSFRRWRMRQVTAGFCWLWLVLAVSEFSYGVPNIYYLINPNKDPTIEAGRQMYTVYMVYHAVAVFLFTMCFCAIRSKWVKECATLGSTNRWQLISTFTLAATAIVYEWVFFKYRKQPGLNLIGVGMDIAARAFVIPIFSGLRWLYVLLGVGRPRGGQGTGGAGWWDGGQGGREREREREREVSGLR
jgi:hypothetical protein